MLEESGKIGKNIFNLKMTRKEREFPDIYSQSYRKNLYHVSYGIIFLVSNKLKPFLLDFKEIVN